MFCSSSVVWRITQFGIFFGACFMEKVDDLLVSETSEPLDVHDDRVAPCLPHLLRQPLKGLNTFQAVRQYLNAAGG